MTPNVLKATLNQTPPKTIPTMYIDSPATSYIPILAEVIDITADETKEGARGQVREEEGRVSIHLCNEKWSPCNAT